MRKCVGQWILMVSVLMVACGCNMHSDPHDSSSQLITATSGNIVLSHDVNTFAVNRAGSDEATFAVNVANFLAGAGGTILLFETHTDNERNFSPVIVDALTSAGFAVTLTTDYTTPYTSYDAIFVSRDYPVSGFLDNVALIDYVDGGGGVYLTSGVGGPGSAPAEAAGWDTFVNHFGLDFANSYNQVQFVPITSAHPIFAGVSGLDSGNGASILNLGTNPDAQIVQTTTGGGAYAVVTGP